MKGERLCVCSAGGNEESELYELQTAHDWSEEEERDRGGEDEDYDDDGDLASSPSIWGTPHQHSFELTFSYIAIAEAEAVGATRHHREGSGRRRGGARLGRTPLVRTDTLETLLPLDSPDVEWDPHAFLTLEEAEEGARRRREEEEEESERRERLAESEAGPRQSSLLDGDLEALERNVTLGRERGRRESPQHHHGEGEEGRRRGWGGEGERGRERKGLGRGRVRRRRLGIQWERRKRGGRREDESKERRRLDVQCEVFREVESI